MQRWDGEHQTAPWEKVNAVAIAYLQSGNDPLDYNKAEQYATDQGLDHQESKWLRSIFADPIRYDTTDSKLYTNGRHRSLAMSRQGVSHVVIQDENIINQHSRQAAALRQDKLSIDINQLTRSVNQDVFQVLEQIVIDDSASPLELLELLNQDVKPEVDATIKAQITDSLNWLDQEL